MLAEQLGLGGFGEVWLAKHPKMASLLGAVKFCHGQQARDLQHEGGLIDRVMQHGDHPNIVPLLDVNLDGDTPWLMFKYVPGGDLADLIREWQATAQEVRVSRAVAALRELAAAVGQFHTMTPAVVHRDLKPSNILRCRATGKLRITDFGIGAVTAKAALVEESRGGGTRGGRLLSYLRGSYTPLYASPQQRDGHDPDPRDDVHALGVIGYQMLTGNLTQGVGTDFVEDLKEAHADDELIELLRKCTAQKADRRPKDATELAERLARLNSKPVPPPVPPAGTRVKVHCPSCRAAMQAPTAYLGKVVVCPTCKSSFKAAETPGPTTAARHFDITLEGTWHSPAPDGDAVTTLPGRVTVEPGGRYKIVGSGFGDDLANGLKSLPRVPELKVIDIRWSSLLPANLDALDGFPALDELHLMIYVTDAELPRLAHLPLRTLNLLISPVSDAGLRTVGTFPTLESLDLSQCPNVTSAGVAHLVGLSALQNLDLSETKINDVAGAWLAKMPRLRKLSVNRTGMSKSGIEGLRKALPDCAITADDLRVK